MSMYRQNQQQGSLTLEAALVLPIFLFIILFVFSFFGIVSAHNEISHALIQSSSSLSMDPYLFEQAALAGESTTSFWGGMGDMFSDIKRLDNDPYFMAHTDWYTPVTETTTPSSVSTIKRRFIGYLAGGNELKADKKLTDLRVKDGLKGVQFTAEVVGDDLKITIEYSLRMLFDFGQDLVMPVKQSVTVRLWK